MTAPLHLGHRIPALPGRRMSAKRDFENRRKHLLSLHRQQHPLRRLLGPTRSNLLALRLFNPPRNIPPDRIAQLRVPLRQSLLLAEDLLQLRRSLNLPILKIRLHRQVNHPADGDSRRLLHLFIHQNEMPVST